MPPTPFRRPKRLILDELKKCGAVAVIRAEVTEQLPETVAALLAGGLRAIEITLTTPDGVGVIAELAARYSRDDILLGAGTVLDPEEAAAAIAAGAEYIVSPSIELDVIAYCRDVGVASIPGAY
ncbi:MAG TPA: hypothetical protein PJ982_13775, partial [Lacipirellulaceae bacterium]|nr:hypothetical protein [Lacipirellulaceae bacterium]